MKKYKYLLFDNDGTLMDFKKCEEYAFETAYKRSGAHDIIPYSGEILKLYSEVNDSWWKKLERKECTREELMKGRFKEFLSKLNINSINPETLSNEYPVCLSESCLLFDGAKELLSALYEHYHIYIITNGIGFVQKKRISKCEYLPFIEGIFISEELGAVKPEKEYFSKVLSYINAKKEECLIIGDSLSADIKGGNLSGIDTLWYNPEKLNCKNGINPTFTFHNYSDILSFLL